MARTVGQESGSCHLLQLIKHDLAEFASRESKIVRYVRCFDPELVCNLFVSKLLAALIDIVELEQFELRLPVARITFFSQALQ